MQFASSARLGLGIRTVYHESFPKSMTPDTFVSFQANLQRAIQRLHHVIVFSNQDLSNPYQFVALYENGQMMVRKENL
jgi:hypothetical protein